MSRTLGAVALSLLPALAPACRGSGPARPAPASAPAPRWSEGDAYVYRVDLASTSRVASSPAPVAFRLTGALTLRPRLAGGTTTLLATMSDVRFGVESDGGDAIPAGTEHDIEGPWAFDVVDGRAAALHLPAGIRPLGVGIVSTLAAAFQAPTAPSDGGVWTGDESDGSGKYTARYQAGSEPGVFTKSKVAYQKTSMPLTAGPLGTMDWTPTVVASSGELHLQGPDLVTFKERDELEVAFTAASRVDAVTQLELELAEHRTGAPAVDWQAVWASTSLATMGAPLASAPAARALDERMAANVTFQDALAALEHDNPDARGPGAAAASAAGDTSLDAAREHLDAFGRMVAVLRTRPADVPLAVSAIEHRSPVRRPLVNALGSAGSPAAQTALVRFMQSTATPEDTRRDAAFALVRTPEPAEASLAALIDGLSDPLVRQYAVYGIGTYARRLRTSGKTEAAAKAVDALLLQLDASSTASARADVLRGIANSGDVRAFPRVRTLLDDPDDSIRAAAVDAIRLMPNPEVEPLLVAHMSAREAAAVRSEALDAATLRTPSDGLVRAVSEVAAGAPDSQTRAKAVRILEKWMKTHPEVRAVLEQVARSDSREAVRRAAKSALGT